MYSEPNRAFSYAVLASIVLHGMLLFAVSQPRHRIAFVEPDFPPLIARLVEPPAPPPAAEEPLVIPPEVRPPPAVKPPKPTPAPRRKAQAPKPLVEPLPEPEPPAVAEVPAAPEPAPPPPLIARTDPAPSAPAVAAPPPPGVEAVPESVTLAQYRSELLNMARKYKRYPRAAMENNWEGQVVVRLAVGANGSLAGLTVRSGSGYALLDQQALEMFRKAAAAVQVPSALRGREFTLEVRAIYNLTDQVSG